MITDYVIQNSDNGGVINLDVRNEPFAVQLPAPVANFRITIKDVYGSAASNPITVLRDSSSTQIDSEVNDDIINQNFGSISYMSDGTGWFRISGYI